MDFYIGGKYNGKITHVLDKYGIKSYFDINKDDIYKIPSFRIINNVDEIIAYIMKNNIEETILLSLLKKDHVIIGNIITNGVVPIDRFNRQLRDETGIMFKKIVEMSDKVYKITYGLEQLLK